MPKITIPQKQLELNVESGVNLMNVLLDAGLPVASSCHGEGVCSMCRVKVDAGQIAAPENFEIDCLKRNKAEPNERLSCQISVTDNLTIRTKYW
jgi:ferredoxin, 2Fe-2S